MDSFFPEVSGGQDLAETGTRTGTPRAPRRLRVPGRGNFVGVS